MIIISYLLGGKYKGGVALGDNKQYFVNDVYQKIWKDRYRKHNESYVENLKRVAKFISSAEPNEVRDKYYEKFLEVMKNRWFFPGGRTMSNSGIGQRLTLNNCFVAPIIPNNMEGIFDSVKLGAITHKAGGGIGYNFSSLSPRGAETKNDAIASGPVSFMDVFNAQTRTVQQGSRRGANMGILSVYHPDIYEFIEAKSKDANRLNHFNVSVIVDDEFMNAVVNNQAVELHYPVYDKYGNKVNEKEWNPKFTKKVNAVELWEKIMRMAYDNGEPGIFFEDTMKRKNPANYVENIICSNPCSEYLAGTIQHDNDDPTDYGGACNLGSIFLHNFVKDPFTTKSYIDYDNLYDTVEIAIRMLDDIIDINNFPNKIYKNYQKNMRTIGLGYTGLGDMLAMLGLKYNSKEARNFVDNLLHNITEYAYLCSVELAKEKGAFPFCDKEKHGNSEFVMQELSEDTRRKILEYGIRNAKILAVAPCGTISMAYGNNCSSGIEPIFSLSYERKVKVGGQEEENTQIVKMMDYAYYLYNKMVEDGKQVDYKPDDIFVTALNIDVKDHIDMLATISKHIDMSVSKTINVPTEYPFEKVKDIYISCWQKGIKGCTIFRPNEIRQGILIAERSESDESGTHSTSSKSVNTLNRGDIVECSNDLIGKKRKIVSGCGSLHILAFFDPVTGDMQEVYLNKGSTGGCSNFMTGLSRTISLLCRAGVDVRTIKDQLDSTGACPSYATRSATKHDTSKGSCCPMAIGNALVEMWKEMRDDIDEDWEDQPTQVSSPKPNQIVTNSASICPECGEPLVFEGGCNSCKSCGYSKCN